jgi:hypothetical protein
MALLPKNVESQIEGLSIGGLWIFALVLIASVTMLIINAVYFFKVYNDYDDSLNEFWSRTGALLLAIFNVFFAVLLFIVFYNVGASLIKKQIPANDATCLKTLNLDIEPDSGLPNPKFAGILEANGIAFASTDTRKTGYRSGITGPGPLPEGGSWYNIPPTPTI